MLSQTLKSSLFILLIISVQYSVADVYLHNPRGSNNRLNETTAARQNNNRLFDSQNNARGGYNVGDATSQPATNEQQQYQMRYFQSGSTPTGQSLIDIEWTNQHGCGDTSSDVTPPQKQDCQIVLQYMCQPKTDYAASNVNRMRDGLSTQSQAYTALGSASAAANEDAAGFAARKQADVSATLGLHETWQWYDACASRERNGGLFTADQGLGRNQRGYSGAVYTRQNPNGARSGYECPEERDYWPYWHPSPWRDVAVLASNLSACAYFTAESFNVKPKSLCVEYYNTTSTQKTWSRWNNQADCIQNAGIWVAFYSYLEKAPQYTDEKSCVSQSTSSLTYIWAVPYDSANINQKECLVQAPPPLCQQVDWTRSNHLGNTLDGQAPRFHWQLPYFPSRRVQTCVLRIRYNVSTDDYDPYTTDSRYNGINSPIKNDPLVDIGANKQVLQLAVNTNQYGRVFQDRSHTFLLLPRSTLIGDSVKVYNLNIRGKRGNIVQVYPAVEYDFVPTNLSVTTNDLVHIQWTGSNTHLNGGNSDGQAGNDGQGNQGTDRNNLVQINDLNENFPLPFEMSSLWSTSGGVSLVAYLNGAVVNYTDDASTYLMQSSNSDNMNKDLALYLSSAGYYGCVRASTCQSSSYETLSSSSQLDADLNAAPASLPGALIRFINANQVFFYMCSRNNNFSNRSQKGAFYVVS